MNRLTIAAATAAMFIPFVPVVAAARPTLTPSANPEPAGGIQWFTRLKDGLAEAKRTGKPILYLSAAPSCGGISGVW